MNGEKKAYVIGTIKLADEIGKKGREKFIWEACPRCCRPRWVRKRKQGKICAVCNGRRQSDRIIFNDQQHKGLATCHRYIRLGKLAEALGWTEESLQAEVAKRGK